MPLITLRTKAGVPSPTDLTVEIRDNTYEYLTTSDASAVRVSAYLDRDWPLVADRYAELFVSEDCRWIATVNRILPGSRERKGITLPGAMKKGEQLTVEVTRKPRTTAT